jgi:hypothetical protein
MKIKGKQFLICYTGEELLIIYTSFRFVSIGFVSFSFVSISFRTLQVPSFDSGLISKNEILELIVYN